jgi:hypothetical protein
VSTAGVDEAAFHELRGGASGTAGTHDCLATCFFVLKHHALLQLAPRLGLAVHLPANADHGGTAELAASAAAAGLLLVPQPADGRVAWAEAEAALWALGAVAHDVVRVLVAPLSAAGPGTELRVVQQQALGSTLVALLQHLVGGGRPAGIAPAHPPLPGSYNSSGFEGVASHMCACIYSIQIPPLLVSPTAQVAGQSPSAQLVRRHPLLLKAAAACLGKLCPLLKADPQPAHSLGMGAQRPSVQALALQVAQRVATAAAATLGGDGAAWTAPALLPGALAVLLAALAEPAATEAAAKGFRAVCTGAPGEVAAGAFGPCSAPSATPPFRFHSLSLRRLLCFLP